MTVIHDDKGNSITVFPQVNSNRVMPVDVQQTVGLVDDVTGASIGIDFPHHEIHEGDHYFLYDFADLTNAATQDILIITPDTAAYTHLSITVEHELEGQIAFRENVKTSSNGTEQSTFNSNRNSTNTAGTKIYETPTITNTGVLLAQNRTGSSRQFGGGARSEAEFVLRRNTKYLLRMTNGTANNNIFNWSLIWYEHTNE